MSSTSSRSIPPGSVGTEPLSNGEPKKSFRSESSCPISLGSVLRHAHSIMRNMGNPQYGQPQYGRTPIWAHCNIAQETRMSFENAIKLTDSMTFSQATRSKGSRAA
eukprot:7390975-Prymnesium_polylepis.1